MTVFQVSLSIIWVIGFIGFIWFKAKSVAIYRSLMKQNLVGYEAFEIGSIKHLKKIIQETGNNNLKLKLQKVLAYNSIAKYCMFSGFGLIALLIMLNGIFKLGW